MKHLLNNMSEEEKNIIREQHGMRVVTENFHKLLGSKLGDVKPLLNEQLSLLSINSASILFSNGDNTKQIKLKGIDPTTKKPLVLKYNIKGQYPIWGKYVGFDVNLRNIKRAANGDLLAEAQPNNKLVANAVESFIPVENLTTDGWVKVTVPAQKINESIMQLKKNNGGSATIDAGHKITITLTYAK